MTKNVETENIQEVETEHTKEIETENSEEIGREVKKKDIVDLSSMGFSAPEPRAGPQTEMLKSAMKSYCFIQNTLLKKLEGD